MAIRLLFAGAVAGVVRFAEAAQPPHIVFVMADDLGSNDVGWQDASVKSSEIDALAKEGVKLSHMYTYMWCAPSRGAFLSGRYAPKSGWEGAGGGPSSEANGHVGVFPTEYEFLPARLKKAGYRTIMAGKWHVGFAREADMPENRGFDKYLGYLLGGQDYYTRKAVVKTADCSTSLDFWYGTPGNGRPAADKDYWTEEYSTTLYTDFLVKQIEHHNTSVPLFIYASYQGVHYPLQVPKPYFDRYKDQGADEGDCLWENQKLTDGHPNGFSCEANPQWPDLASGLDCFCNRLLVKAQVSALSEAVGNLTTALKSRGMWENTVLVFMGDNGGPTGGAHSNYPLRGGKLNFFEGGIRPAAFITSPLLPQAVRGTVRSAIGHETDWYATFCRLAGVAPQVGVDGVDMWDALTASKPHREEVLITDHILRKGAWKLVAGVGRPEGVGAWRTGMLKGCILGNNGGWASPPTNSSNMCPKDVYTSNGKNMLGCPDDKKADFHVTSDIDKWLCSAPCTMAKPCLWDVDNDERETEEVAAQHPDVVKSMLARLREHQEDFRGQTTVADNGNFCAVVKSRRVPRLGLFAGPWIEDNATTYATEWSSDAAAMMV